MGTNRSFVAGGVALIGAGVIAATPVTAPPPAGHDITLTSGDHTDIVIDVVRHGQRMPPFNDQVTPSPDHPGPPLSDLGEQQAQDVANQLNNELGDHVAGIFSGQAIRDMDTAAPFADLEQMTTQILPGLNEIDSGIYAGAPLDSLSGFLYELTPLLWTLFGLVLLPIPGSVEDPNGVAMNERFTDAVNTMYNYVTAPDDPIVSDNGEITAVAFNNEADVAAWVALNVKNPDIAFLLPLTLQTMFDANDGMPLLPNTGVIQIEGNPTDGWTLVSWNGTPIPEDPGLLTKLVVDLRDLVVAPQTALWNIWEAIQGGDPATIENALETGLHNVGSAIIQFPGAVFNDIADTLSNLGSDAAGQTAGETATSLADVWAGLI